MHRIYIYIRVIIAQHKILFFFNAVNFRNWSRWPLSTNAQTGLVIRRTPKLLYNDRRICESWEQVCTGKLHNRSGKKWNFIKSLQGVPTFTRTNKPKSSHDTRYFPHCWVSWESYLHLHLQQALMHVLWMVMIHHHWTEIPIALTLCVPGLKRKCSSLIMNFISKSSISLK